MLLAEPVGSVLRGSVTEVKAMAVGATKYCEEGYDGDRLGWRGDCEIGNPEHKMSR